jgi:NitT/TauT family transport system substrate-binding protein
MAPERVTRPCPIVSLHGSAAATLRVGVLVIASLFLATAALGQEVIRVGHFPNITHAQALVARNFERQGRSWFEPRMPQGVRIQWFAYNAGPSAMEAIFAGSLDLTYVGPNPAINAYARSGGDEIRVVAGAMTGGSALVVQGDAELYRAGRFPRQAYRDAAVRQHPGRRRPRLARRRRATDHPDRRRRAGRADRQPRPARALRREADRRRLDGRALGVAAGTGGRRQVLVEETEAVTTLLVSRAAFLAGHEEAVRRFVAAHRELTEWIVRNPEEAQRMVTEELRLQFRITHRAGGAGPRLGPNDADERDLDREPAGLRRGRAGGRLPAHDA